LSRSDLENLLQMMKQAARQGFREMVMERLRITITSKSVKLKTLESNSQEVCIPHEEMRFLIKMFPLFIELFYAIRTQELSAKKRLLDLLLLTFALSKVIPDNFDPESLFPSDEVDGSLSASKARYESLLRKAGVFTKEQLMPYAFYAYHLCQLLNLPQSAVLEFTGVEAMEKIFHEKAFDFLRRYVEKNDAPTKAIINAALLFNKNNKDY